MAQNRDWQHSFRCKICKTSKGLALGHSVIGSLKKHHAEGDTQEKNIYGVTQENFFQPSSSKSIVIKDDDVSCYSHSNTQQGFNKPTRPSQSIFDQGTTSITLLKGLLKGQSESIFVQIGWGQMKSKHIIFIVKKRTGRGRGFKNGNI